jgi:flagellar assembly factor FliW
LLTVTTRDFGEKQFEDQDILTFPHGVPGFENHNRFVLIHPEESAPFSFMQSLDESQLAFIVTNPFLFYGQYEFALSDKIIRELEIESEPDVAVWAVVSIAESAADSTINLLAPIVVNTRNRVGKQTILHQSEYKTKHKLRFAEQAEAMTERK